MKVLITMPRVQLVTVFGKNEGLRLQLGRLPIPRLMRVLHLGYVQSIHDHLSVAIVVITKPGGLTVTECRVKKKPMIFLIPYRGKKRPMPNLSCATVRAFWRTQPINFRCWRRTFCAIKTCANAWPSPHHGSVIGRCHRRVHLGKTQSGNRRQRWLGQKPAQLAN